MTNFYRLLIALLLSGVSVSYAQTTLPMATNLKATYAKGTRTLNGAPGKNYWQNSADYTVTINFNPQERNLDGIVSVN